MIGDVIGNFRVVKRLGSGGMGDVYLAEHKDLQTPVAVKLLNRDISTNKDHVQRFFNEARIVSKIKSAGTVKIFDSGFHEDQAYLIMELLDGESLATRISERGPLPVAQVLDISRQIASVLDATHRQSVTHRDLKPDNIFIVHDDERASGERVKILDFGIAKLSGTLAVASPKTSGTMGTPAYMAPEQWGDSSKIDWRADAYSLGCVMFELACGRPPFLSATIAEAFVNHVTDEPPTPSSLAPDVPPELDQLILRLLAKDPAARAESMGHVTRELAALMGEPMREPMRERAPSQPSLAQSSQPSLVVPSVPSPSTSEPAHRPTPYPSSHPVAVPLSTSTTLGGSAAELHESPPRKRPLALLAGIGTVAVGVAVFAIITLIGKDERPDAQPAAAPAPPAGAPAATEPPQALPLPPAPPPVAAPSEPAAPVVVEPPTPVVVEKPAPPVISPAAPVTAPTRVRPRNQGASTTTTPPKPTTTNPVGTATTAVETKPVETKRVETKPVETKPVETKPVETKPAEGTGSGSATTGRRRFGGGGRL